MAEFNRSFHLAAGELSSPLHSGPVGDSVGGTRIELRTQFASYQDPLVEGRERLGVTVIDSVDTHRKSLPRDTLEDPIKPNRQTSGEFISGSPSGRGF